MPFSLVLCRAISVLVFPLHHHKSGLDPQSPETDTVQPFPFPLLIFVSAVLPKSKVFRKAISCRLLTKGSTLKNHSKMCFLEKGKSSFTKLLGKFAALIILWEEAGLPNSAIHMSSSCLWSWYNKKCVHIINAWKAINSTIQKFSYQASL